jgi:hypothetical protein
MRLSMGTSRSTPCSTACAPRGEEGVRHSAADQDLVHARQKAVDNAELVGDLRAAEHDRIGRLGRREKALEHTHLVGHQPARRRRQDLSEVVDARLLAVHDAEAVGHHHIGELRELLGEGPPLGIVLARLTGVEAKVLEHGDLTVLERRNGLLRGGADGVGREGDRRSEKLAQAGGDGSQRVRGIGLALRPAEVRARDDLRAGLEQRGDRRKRGADPAVVCDGAVGQRHVEVAAHEYALAREIAQRIQGTESHGYT